MMFTSQKYLILDASCLINLYASGKMEDILKAVPESVVVADYVLHQESLWIYDGPSEAVREKKRPIDLQPFVSSHLLQVVDIEFPEEANLFVEFATKMDDGEALTGAIAVHRRWAIVVDDKRARNFFQREFSDLQMVYSLEIVKHWATTTKAPDAVVSTVLWGIRNRGVYVPANNHPLWVWWDSYMNE